MAPRHRRHRAATECGLQDQRDRGVGPTGALVCGGSCADCAPLRRGVRSGSDFLRQRLAGMHSDSDLPRVGGGVARHRRRLERERPAQAFLRQRRPVLPARLKDAGYQTGTPPPISGSEAVLGQSSATQGLFFFFFPPPFLAFLALVVRVVLVSLACFRVAFEADTAVPPPSLRCRAAISRPSACRSFTVLDALLTSDWACLATSSARTAVAIVPTGASTAVSARAILKILCMGYSLGIVKKGTNTDLQTSSRPVCSKIGSLCVESAGPGRVDGGGVIRQRLF